MFLDEMGLAEHQAIYALHRNTNNWHLHLAVNRVHPETEKLVTVNNGFDHEVAHRAIARIEQRQGWEPAPHPLYDVRPDGEPERARPRGEGERQPSARARDFEERLGPLPKLRTREVVPTSRIPNFRDHGRMVDGPLLALVARLQRKYGECFASEAGLRRRNRRRRGPHARRAHAAARARASTQARDPDARVASARGPDARRQSVQPEAPVSLSCRSAGASDAPSPPRTAARPSAAAPIRARSQRSPRPDGRSPSGLRRRPSNRKTRSSGGAWPISPAWPSSRRAGQAARRTNPTSHPNREPPGTARGATARAGGPLRRAPSPARAPIAGGPSQRSRQTARCMPARAAIGACGRMRAGSSRPLRWYFTDPSGLSGHKIEN